MVRDPSDPRESIPVEYLLSTIKVTFKDGKNWEIRPKNNRQKMTHQRVGKADYRTVQDHGDAIKNVHFRLDTNKVKADITKRTKTPKKAKMNHPVKYVSRINTTYYTLGVLHNGTTS